MEKRLYRSRDDRMIWGVCGGIAHYFGIDPTIVRVIAVLLAFADGLGILAYIVLAIIVPLENSPSREPREIIKENVQEIKQTASQFGEDMRSTFARQEGEVKEMRRTGQGHYLFGTILVVVGAIFLLNSFFPWLKLSILWPVILIAIGLLIIFGARRK